jgi:hypothetical protein
MFSDCQSFILTFFSKYNYIFLLLVFEIHGISDDVINIAFIHPFILSPVSRRRASPGGAFIFRADFRNRFESLVPPICLEGEPIHNAELRAHSLRAAAAITFGFRQGPPDPSDPYVHRPGTLNRR